MFLSERKIHILEAIINDYIQLGEPIGSRTITKKYNFGLSSATIRNEMSDLEEMGYITQPHASAGRAPTDKGYRLYVDKLMRHRELKPEEIEFLQTMIKKNIDRMDYLMEETAKAVSVLTNYTSLAVPSKLQKTKIKVIQLMPVDYTTMAFVLITGEKIVKNSMITVSHVPDYEVLLRLSAILNAHLQGKTSKDINKTLSGEIIRKTASMGDYSEIIINTLETAMDLLQQEEQANIYLSGAKNILGFPEFSDTQIAKDLLQTFEEKDLLITLLGSDEDDAMQIVIGDENYVKQMKNCSIIKTSVKADGKNYGSIGILGPTRMDYAQVTSVLNVIVKSIEKTLKSLSGG